MSDIADTSSKPKPSPKAGARTDNQAFAQIEKWMAMIREIGDEPTVEHRRAGFAPRVR